jgi:hypothetical protein
VITNQNLILSLKNNSSCGGQYYYDISKNWWFHLNGVIILPGTKKGRVFFNDIKMVTSPVNY